MHWFVHKKLLENFPRYILKNGLPDFQKNEHSSVKNVQYKTNG